MEVGHIIKAERMKQGMKQLVLSKGICTTSYLSRIEQGKIIPSEEIATLLLSKLGINLREIERGDSKNEEFEKYVYDVYRKAISIGVKEIIEQKLMELEKETPFLGNIQIHYTYLLIMLRFRIVVGRNFEEIKKDLVILEDASSHFNTQQLYLHELNKALYYYYVKEIKKSILCLEYLQSIISKVDMDNWEIAELDFIIGTIYAVDNRLIEAKLYIDKALSYFKEQLLMKRVLDGYISMGIIYQKNRQYSEALDTFVKAKQICNEFNLQGYLGIVYHNMGSVKIVMGQQKEGICYFHKSIETKTDKKSHFISIFCLIIEYSRSNQVTLVLKWCNKGIVLYEEMQDESLYAYRQHFEFYKALYENNETSQKKALKMIHYFSKIQDYRHAYKYSIALAEYYLQNKKYKLATFYFQEATKYSYLNKNIHSWEQL
ncbi:helix-turn-helix domain-containing protein [Lysinibacillus louembei]|uniref:Helix-turn-helix domain-containing protein n=1 Tax=Lysinibacillus louembei TaxID=1470088 RepID=A0ABZ0RZE8_9BACI|nr:helix-turn-helix domain-containing protein [Lysinibacillus louembei]WPK12667.1 helix-turn-helix domain-containing protein [Lysinibacillus louembei]